MGSGKTSFTVITIIDTIKKFSEHELAGGDLAGGVGLSDAKKGQQT